MTTLAEQVFDALEGADWTHVDAPEDASFDRLYASSYAYVAVLVRDDPQDLLELWAACQGQLLGMPRARDSYLLLVTPRLKDDLIDRFSPVLGDTHVCRKLLVETRGRDVAEALLDVPFLNVPKLTAVNDLPDRSVERLTPPVPEAIMEALGKNSADRILNDLLSGALGFADETEDPQA